MKRKNIEGYKLFILESTKIVNRLINDLGFLMMDLAKKGLIDFDDAPYLLKTVAEHFLKAVEKTTILLNMPPDRQQDVMEGMIRNIQKRSPEMFKILSDSATEFNSKKQQLTDEEEEEDPRSKYNKS